MSEIVNVKIVIADIQHTVYAEDICTMIVEAAKLRGTGIAKRTPEYIKAKISDGKAVIALDGENVVGFCYIETWEHGKFVANSGLIVHPDYRGHKLAVRIKKKILDLSNLLYPNAKVFGITTSNAVLNINFKLGYKPVTFSELTTDPSFWKGCQGCVNYDILQRTDQKMCLCTGMVYEGNKIKNEQKSASESAKK
ncbi:MAG: GNAT family N-acetyltransferase [Salinivirgaceae bacterium]|jgi:GNAT superfamily N-acetyltransferase|nr:GNAT family N-acetyltransferase [Salinivirgaceae bacterium]